MSVTGGYFCFSLFCKMREITMYGGGNDPVEREKLMKHIGRCL